MRNYNVCSPPYCPQSGYYAIDVQDPGLCGYGTYTITASYRPPGGGGVWQGSKTCAWSAQNDPCSVDIILTNFVSD